VKIRRALTATSLVSVLVVIGMVGYLVHLFAAVPVDAQSVTPTPLSLTPVGAPPPQLAPITANNVDRLTLYTAVNMDFTIPGPIWSPDGRVVILKINMLYALFPPAESPLELELTPTEKEDQTFRVKTLAFSSDGRLIVGGGDFFPGGVLTGFVQVWDSATGKVLAIANDIEGGVLSMALSSNGRVLAAGGGNGIRLWQVAPDGKLLSGPQVLEQYPNVSYLVFSPDSLQLAAHVYSGVAIYSIAPEQESVPLQGRSLTPSQLAFSPDRTLLAAVAEEANSDSLVIWDLKTGIQADLSIPHEGDYSTGGGRLSFSLDGSLLAASHRGEVHIWDVSSGQTVTLMKVEAPGAGPEGTRIDSLAFSPDGTLLMAGDSYGRMMWLWGIQ
jgi:WD40 repeat protein